jgi:hypothetical protein
MKCLKFSTYTKFWIEVFPEIFWRSIPLPHSRHALRNSLVILDSKNCKNSLLRELYISKSFKRIVNIDRQFCILSNLFTEPVIQVIVFRGANISWNLNPSRLPSLSIKILLYIICVVYTVLYYVLHLVTKFYIKMFVI